MITGEIKSRVDRIWDAMWAGGIANPLTVIEQLTYLLFIKRLDELHTLREAKAHRLGKAIEEPVFSAGRNPAVEHSKVDCRDLRWSRFKNLAPLDMFNLVKDEVFPFMKALGQNGKGPSEGEDESSFTRHMKDAILIFYGPNPGTNCVSSSRSLADPDFTR